MENYNVTENEIGGIIELLADETNKDAVDELVTQFIEKIDGEANNKDNLITRGRALEWTNI